MCQRAKPSFRITDKGVASGDMRNMAMTVASLPYTYEQAVAVTMNDRDFEVVARNAIMLLILLTVDNHKAAIDCIIHLWYSVTIKQSHLDILSNHVRPLLQSVVVRIADRTAGSRLAKTWTYGNRALRLVLSKEQWTALLAFTKVPKDLERFPQFANLNRLAITMAPSRVDERQLSLLLGTPSLRFCRERLQQEGILLPLSSSRKDFTIPNP